MVDGGQAMEVVFTVEDSRRVLCALDRHAALSAGGADGLREDLRREQCASLQLSDSGGRETGFLTRCGAKYLAQHYSNSCNLDYACTLPWGAIHVCDDLVAWPGVLLRDARRNSCRRAGSGRSSSAARSQVRDLGWRNRNRQVVHRRSEAAHGIHRVRRGEADHRRSARTKRSKRCRRASATSWRCRAASPAARYASRGSAPSIPTTPARRAR